MTYLYVTTMEITNLESIFTKTDKEALLIFQEKGIIKKEKYCDNGHIMTIEYGGIERLFWRCSKSQCRKMSKLRVIKDTWLEGTNRPLKNILQFIYCWTRELTSIKFCQQELRMSEHTTVQFNNCLREVCAVDLLANKEVIGGPGFTVEISEDTYSKRNHNNDQIEPQCVFGGICRESRKCFLYAMPSRDKYALFECITNNIVPFTRIISDCWATYEGIVDIPGFHYYHETINNKKVVHPVTNVSYTPRIESLWNVAKRRNKKKFGTHKMLDGCLCEFMWRERHKDRDLFKEILQNIRDFNSDLSGIPVSETIEDVFSPHPTSILTPYIKEEDIDITNHEINQFSGDGKSEEIYLSLPQISTLHSVKKEEGDHHEINKFSHNKTEDIFLPLSDSTMTTLTSVKKEETEEHEITQFSHDNGTEESFLPLSDSTVTILPSVKKEKLDDLLMTENNQHQTIYQPFQINVSRQENSLDVIGTAKLLDVPTFKSDMIIGMEPYRVSKVSIEDKIVFSINFIAFCYAKEDTMVPMQEVINEFLPTLDLSESLDVFVGILKLQVYKANRHQICALMHAWSSTMSAPDVVPLLKYSDLKDTLPQIKYIYKNQQSSSQP